MSYVINKSRVIKSNFDYRNDSIGHHLEYAIVLNNIDASLTSIDRALSPNLEAASKENPHALKETDIGHNLKRIVTRKLSNRRKRPTTDG
jgi:hypothetical protein